MRTRQDGFAFLELIVVIGVVAVLLGFTTINVLRLQHQSNLSSVADTLIADSRGQQNQAMVGQTPGATTSADHGMFFETTRYTLFAGTAFNPNDPGNTVVNLPSAVRVSSITVPNATVVFTAGSGEAPGVAAGSDTITLTEETSGLTKTIQWNALGVVVDVR